MPKWIFVWTVQDVFALVFIGVLILIGLLLAADKLWEKVKQALRKAVPHA